MTNSRSPEREVHAGEECRATTAGAREQRSERRDQEAFAPSGRPRSRRSRSSGRARRRRRSPPPSRAASAGQQLGLPDGASTSPRISPATNTARKPEPCATAATPKTSAAKASEIQAAERPSARAAGAPRRGRPRCRRAGRSPSARRRPARRPRTSRRRASRARSARASARSRPGRSRPTRLRGSCPVRPSISRSPRTENITAGSVGATAAPSRPAVIQPSPSAQWAKPATSPAVANVPSTPSEHDRDGRGAEAPQTDRRASVEEDHDERSAGHELDRLDRERQPRERDPTRTRRPPSSTAARGIGEALHEAQDKKVLTFRSFRA